MYHDRYVSNNGRMVTVLGTNGKLIRYKYDDSEMIYNAFPAFWNMFFKPI